MTSYATIMEFHEICCGLDNMFDTDFNSFKQDFSKENVLNAYETSITYNSKIHVNGLFLATISGNFKLAKYLIENEYFDPNEYFCGEVHILHLLATMCGRHNNIKKPITPVFEAISTLKKIYQITFISPIVFYNNYYISEINEKYEYDIDEVVKFASELIDKYKMNVSVPIRWRWWNYSWLEKSQAGYWFEMYRDILFRIKEYKTTYGFSDICLSTPLVFACLFGSQKFVEMLVMKGCDLLCMNCKTICKKCPINILKLLHHSVKKDIDNFLDDEFEIEYDEEELKNLDSNTIQINANKNYLYNKVIDYFMEEQCYLKKYSLQNRIIRKIAKSILSGKYVKDFADLPKSFKYTIYMYIQTYYMVESYKLRCK